MKNLVIIGAGGLSLEIIDLINSINRIKPTYNVLGLLDDYKTDYILEEYKIIGLIKDFKDFKECEFVIASANPRIRKAIYLGLLDHGVSTPNLIHPSTEISNHAIMKDNTGVIINYGTQISAKAKIENCVLIDSQCYIGHETIINSFVTVYPGVKMSGNSFIDKETEIGLGSNIIQGISIGENTLIGAGSTVVSNIPNNVVAVGSPCKPMKNR